MLRSIPHNSLKSIVSWLDSGTRVEHAVVLTQSHKRNSDFERKNDFLFVVRKWKFWWWQLSNQASESVRLRTLKQNKNLLNHINFCSSFTEQTFSPTVCHICLSDSFMTLPLSRLGRKTWHTEDTQLDLFCCLTFGIDLLIVYLLISFSALL